MGRKIPAKKHRGVKDPLLQQAKRLESLKMKINEPPKDPDEQPVPRSLERLFAHQQKHQHKHQHNTKSKKETPNNLQKGGANPVSRLRRAAGESARAFGRRLTAAARALVHAPTAYPIETEDDPPEERAPRRRRVPRAAARAAPRPAARAAAQAPERPEVVYERRAFGEQAHAPPALSQPRRAARTAPRPGARRLLLTGLLCAGGSPSGPHVASGPSAPSAASDPSAAERQRLERARLQAVQAYRALKNSKRKNNHENKNK